MSKTCTYLFIQQVLQSAQVHLHGTHSKSFFGQCADNIVSPTIECQSSAPCYTGSHPLAESIFEDLNEAVITHVTNSTSAEDLIGTQTIEEIFQVTGAQAFDAIMPVESLGSNAFGRDHEARGCEPDASGAVANGIDPNGTSPDATDVNGAISIAASLQSDIDRNPGYWKHGFRNRSTCSHGSPGSGSITTRRGSPDATALRGSNDTQRR